MKNFLTLSVLMAGLAFVSCNDDEITGGDHNGVDPVVPVAQRLDSSYVYSANEVLNYREINSYNERGLLVSTHINNYLSGQWSGNYIVEYTYDANDSLTVRLSYNADAEGNPDPELEMYKIEYTRDAKGKLLSEAQYFKDFHYHLDWTPLNYKYDYTYDAAGNMVSHIYYDCTGPFREFKLSRKEEFTYNNIGLRLSGKRYYWNGSDWYVNGEYKYTYDKQNRLTLYEADYFGSKDRTQYTYDDQRHSTTINYARGNRYLLETIETYVRTYNDRGLLILDVCYIVKNGESQPYSKYEYKYNENGNLVSVTYFKYEVGWKPGSSRQNFWSDLE